MLEDVDQLLDDQNGDNDEEGLADETGPMFQREMGAEVEFAICANALGI